PQSQSQPPTTQRTASEQNEAAKSEQQLRELLRSNPEAFARNNYDYLLARLLEGRGAEAAQYFQTVAQRNSPLAGYALWHLAELARTAGKLDDEQAALQKMIAQFPDHLWRERAILRLSESCFRTGNYQSVLTTLRLLGPRRDLLPRIGEAQLASRQVEAARTSFETALAGKSHDDTSLRAILNLDKLDGAAQLMLSEAEHLRRARALQFNRYFAEARPHWLAVVNSFPQSKARAESLFNLGRGYFLEDKFADARQWYERVGSEFPQTEEGEQGFYYAGHCDQFTGDADKAIARYEAYLKRYPKGQFVGYAHLNAIDTLRTEGRFDEALRWAARAQAEAPGQYFVVTGLFHQAKIRLSKEDFSGALSDLTALRAKNLNVHGLVATTNYPEVNFLRAYCLEKLGRFDEAMT